MTGTPPADREHTPTCRTYGWRYGRCICETAWSIVQRNLVENIDRTLADDES